jgi:hypothetical protein
MEQAMSEKNISNLFKSVTPNMALGIGMAAGFAFLVGIGLGAGIVSTSMATGVWFLCMIAVPVVLLLSRK